MHRYSGKPSGALLARTLLVSAALTGGLGSQLSAQTRDAVPGRDRGWIGVSFDLAADAEGRGYFRIVEVRPGSPAEAAGLRRGDHVLAVNDLDRPDELASLTERLRLRAGDPVVIEIEREGRHHRLRLEAAPIPDDFTVGRTMRLAVESDSMVETWVRAMDSLRSELIARGDEQARLRGDAEGRDIRLRRIAGGDQGRTTIVHSGSGSAPRAPFEFFVFHGTEHDSLRHELAALEHAAVDLRGRIREREGRLGSPAPNAATELLVADEELRRLRQTLSAVSARSAALEAAVAEAARATAGLTRPRAPEAWGARAIESSARSEEPAGFSPLTPYLLGRNRVAGAEVIDLRPELAEYFGVAGGVLVVDVAPRTPASIAGIAPGDVITHVHQTRVRSVDDLRLGVSRAADTLPISLIRQGDSVQVLIRR